MMKVYIGVPKITIYERNIKYILVVCRLLMIFFLIKFSHIHKEAMNSTHNLLTEEVPISAYYATKYCRYNFLVLSFVRIWFTNLFLSRVLLVISFSAAEKQKVCVFLKTEDNGITTPGLVLQDKNKML